MITPSEHFKSLAVTINNAFQFDTHVHRLCKKSNQKLHAFGKLGPYLGSDQSKFLLNIVV